MVKQEVLDIASATLGIPPEDLLLLGLRRYLQSQLHDVQANIFQIRGAYQVKDVLEMEELYQEDKLAEADSWRDLQRLDHLEYKQERLQHLLGNIHA